MNILQLTNKVPFPPKDGGAIATLNLTKGFAHLGHKVTMLAMNTNKHYSDIAQIPEHIKNIVHIIGIDVNTRITIFSALYNLLFSKLPYNAQRFISKKYENALIELLIENKYDVIQLEGLYLGLYIPVIRKYSDALISMRSHNIEHEIWQRTALINKNGWRKKYLQILSKRIKLLNIQQLNKYDVLVPITKRDAKVFDDLGNNIPTHITPTGINAEELIPDNKNLEYPSLFYIGALDWAPNQEGLLWFLKNVWKLINKKHPELKFYIAGRNAPDLFKQKIKLSSFINRGNNIVFLGEVENAYDFMKSKAIMVVPLLSASGMRIKIIEGMSLGKTIISTSIGTEGIDTTHNENILIANSPSDFVQEIEKLLIDKNIFENIGRNAVKFVKENFDNLTITASLIDFYESHKK